MLHRGPGQVRYRGPLLRRTTASTAIMTTQDQIAALTLKKDTAIESRKMTGIAKPRIRKKRTSLVSWT